MTPAKPTFLAATAAVTAKALNLDPQHVGAGIAKAVESVWVTAAAVASSLVIGSAAHGDRTPSAFLAFAAANWWAALATVASGLIRARQGYVASKNG